MAWWRITAYPVPCLVDEVADVFVEHTGGAAVQDPALIDRVISCGGEDAAPDLDRPSRPVVQGYLPPGKRSVGRRRRLLAGLARLEPRPRVVTGFCRSEDWDSAWQKYYHVHRVGRRLVVVPAWETYVPAPGETPIRMDPGPAFGTGTHPSTELCLELLEDLNLTGAVVADVGTGSGILAIAAVLLGAARVAAVDVDETALRWAAKNAALNCVTGGVEFYEGGFLTPVGAETFHLVTANLTADLLSLLAPAVGARLKDGGLLIAGGIIGGRAAGVRDVLSREGFLVLQEIFRGEWVAFLAGRGSF